MRTNYLYIVVFLLLNWFFFQWDQEKVLLLLFFCLIILFSYTLGSSLKSFFSEHKALTTNLILNKIKMEKKLLTEFFQLSFIFKTFYNRLLLWLLISMKNLMDMWWCCIIRWRLNLVVVNLTRRTFSFMQQFLFLIYKEILFLRSTCLYSALDNHY